MNQQREQSAVCITIHNTHGMNDKKRENGSGVYTSVSFNDLVGLSVFFLLIGAK
jgi:hypothetical protein